MLNVQEISVSNNGGPKRLFDIVDGTGTYIHCCALGRNATNLALRPAMEAVFFFMEQVEVLLVAQLTWSIL